VGTCGGEGLDLATVDVPHGMLRMTPFLKRALHSVVIFGMVSCSWSEDMVFGGGMMQKELLSEIGDGRSGFFLATLVLGSSFDLASRCRLAL